MIVLPHSSPNDFHNSFNNTRSPDLTNPSITNYPSIAQSSMYQTTQQSFVYPPSTNNNNLTNQQHFVVAAAHSRSPSTSTISRNSPADTASFAIDSGSFYRYDTTNNINGDSRSSPVQQSQALISNTMSSTPDNNNTTTNSIGVNVLPPISEVLQQQKGSQQQQQQQSSPSTPASSSPTQSQMVPNIQVQTQTSANGIPISMTAPTGQSVSAGFYQYPEVNAAYTSTQADQTFATQSSLQQAMNQQAAAAAAAALSQQHHHQAAQQQQQALSQQALDQTTSNGMVVDPRTLPPIVGTTASDMQLMDATAHRRNSILTINTAGIPVPGTDASPISANSSTGSPILSTGAGATTITYHSPDAAAAAAAAAQQALFTNLMANNVIMQTPQRTVNTTTGRRRSDTIAGNDPAAQVTMNSQPQKVYSFVPLPGINTKKRPRRRYDEIERHYSCEWPGCTKAYGTLNHLNAHVQMQKHGPKRHPSEFKELRKQWRRQKREEEERKAAEAQAKQNTALLNSNLTPI